MKKIEHEEDLTLEVECEDEVTLIALPNYTTYDLRRMKKFYEVRQKYFTVSNIVENYAMNVLHVNLDCTDVFVVNMDVDEEDEEVFECDFVLMNRYPCFISPMIKYHYDNDCEFNCYEEQMTEQEYKSVWHIWYETRII